MSRSTPPGAFKLPRPSDSLAVDTGWSVAPPPPAGDLTRGGTLPEGPRARPASVEARNAARAHGTLLGVAPPQPDTSMPARAGSPVFVRSGVARLEQSRPLPPALPEESSRQPQAPSAVAAALKDPGASLSESLDIPVAPQPQSASPQPPLAPQATAVPPPKTTSPSHPRPVSDEPSARYEPAPALVAPVAPAGVLRGDVASSRSLGAALTARVRFAGAEPALWRLLVPCVGLLLVGAMAAAAATASWLTSATLPTQAVDRPAAASSSAQHVSPPAGDQAAPEAHAVLRPTSESLTADQVLALARAAAERERRAAQLLREKLARQPSALSKAELVELRRLAADPNTAQEALAAIAALPGSESVDLLYEVWTGTPTRTDATELARALVYSRDVRSKASEALSIALDLRQAEACDRTRELLPRAQQVGDRRSLQLLIKLQRKQGCGPNKKQDCYACLRDGVELDAATTAVKARRAPNPFAAL